MIQEEFETLVGSRNRNGSDSSTVLWTTRPINFNLEFLNWIPLSSSACSKTFFWTFASQNKTTTADNNGNWSLFLDKLDKSAQPREMQVSENGKIQKNFKNVLVGEVWILGGQSNMAYFCNEMPLEYRKHHYENADNMKNVRQFTMNPAIIAETPQFHCTKGAKWIDANKQNFNKFSKKNFVHFRYF